MHQFRGNPDYDHQQSAKTGVLLVNLGTLSPCGSIKRG